MYFFVSIYLGLPQNLKHTACLIPTAKKVDTFLSVLCLTAETLRVSPPTGPSLIPRGAFALFSGPLRGPQSRPLYQRPKESFSIAAGIRPQSRRAGPESLSELPAADPCWILRLRYALDGVGWGVADQESGPPAWRKRSTQAGTVWLAGPK